MQCLGCVQEKYDRYMECKLKEFKRVARLLVGHGGVSEKAICAVVETVKGDVLACRASEWLKEKEKLHRRIEDKEDTESIIEAQVIPAAYWTIDISWRDCGISELMQRRSCRG